MEKTPLSRVSLSRMSLRAKVTGISLAIISLALAFSATMSILQMRHEIAVEEGRSVNSVAMGVASAIELAMNVQDTHELSRLANSFLRIPDIEFIAAYRRGSTPLMAAYNDKAVWDAYQAGKLDPATCVTAEHSINKLADEDEFAGELGLEPSGSQAKKKTTNKTVGAVVVGLSTESTRQALWREAQMTIGLTLAAAGIGAFILFITLGRGLRRLQNLANASQAISDGDFSHSVNDPHRDEIGNLARSFDAMRLRLIQRDKKLRGLTVTLQDQVKQRTKDLETALLTAEEANRAKSMFLANMSHELRTPLNGVIGMVDLLLATTTSSQQRRYCDVAKVSAHSLLDLINDTLDFSKIEAGKLELDEVDFNLHETVEGATQMFGERAQKKGLELHCEINPQVPARVRGDPVRLRQVIVNLVSNAIKFTEQGEVAVTVNAMGRDGDDHTIKVEVRDSGVGIPKDRLHRLFKSFSQVDASTTRKFGGTGLGLAISQRIVEIMGGEIGVQSEEKQGSMFWFTAHLKEPSAPEAEKPQGTDLQGLRVLVVDDNTSNRWSLLAQLHSWSVRADGASNGPEAMEMLRAPSDGDPYRIVIAEMHMRSENAEQLVREIKSDPRIHETTVIGLSSMTDAMKPSEMQQIGLAQCLSKPVLPSNLYNAIAGLLARSAAREQIEMAAETGEWPLAGMNVLLAEDHEINRMVAEEILNRFGCRIAMAFNGKEAVEATAREEFDAILMDCQMPEMDGIEATRMIRKMEREAKTGRHVPIIALTANAIKGDRELCLAAGMDGYVTKPIEAEEVLMAIQAVLPKGNNGGGASTAKSAEGAATTAPAPVQASTQQPAAADLPPVDFQSLKRRCMGNKKLAAKALETFGATIEGYVQELSKCLQSGDAKTAGSTAHKIKGAAANVSADAVSRLAGELEALSKRDEISQSENALSQLQREVERARQFISTGIRELVES
jgi:signal transduction histidine kinase/DNA-binding response OmpR family regulator